MTESVRYVQTPAVSPCLHRQRANTKAVTPARAECARSPVAEALKALEWAGALTDGDGCPLKRSPRKPNRPAPSA